MYTIRQAHVCLWTTIVSAKARIHSHLAIYPCPATSLPFDAEAGDNINHLKKGTTMKTKEELMAMSHEELVEYALTYQNITNYQERQIERLRDLFCAVNIATECYRNEFNKRP